MPTCHVALVTTATYPHSAIPVPATPTESRGFCYAPRMTQPVSTDTPEISALRVKANAGDAEAQHDLGNAYNFGEGVPQDDAQAAAWYSKATEQGYAEAQHSLGRAYLRGEGVPQNYRQAATWTRKAAEQGQPYAQRDLGVMYQTGQGVPQDYVESHKWCNLAAARVPFAKHHVAFAEARDRVAELMTPTQIAAAQKLAREWLAAFEKRGGT